MKKEILENVAKNARLKLTEKEIKEFTLELEEVLKSFSILDKIDTKNVEPSFQPLEIKNVFREDIIKKSLSQEEALSNTKNKKDGYFKGPKAI